MNIFLSALNRGSNVVVLLRYMNNIRTTAVILLAAEYEMLHIWLELGTEIKITVYTFIMLHYFSLFYVILRSDILTWIYS